MIELKIMLTDDMLRDLLRGKKITETVVSKLDQTELFTIVLEYDKRAKQTQSTSSGS